MSEEKPDLPTRLRSAFAAWGLRNLGDEAAEEIERLRAALTEITTATDAGAYFTARRVAKLAVDGEERRSEPKSRRWRHVKRGTIYTEVCRAELQATYVPEEGELMVIYRGSDGNTWVRAAGEFEDGRFEVLPDA